jgi:hypothetical protein
VWEIHGHFNAAATAAAVHIGSHSGRHIETLVRTADFLAAAAVRAFVGYSEQAHPDVSGLVAPPLDSHCHTHTSFRSRLNSAVAVVDVVANFLSHSQWKSWDRSFVDSTDYAPARLHQSVHHSSAPCSLQN